MINRNRAEGWQYAKLSGHENEYCVSELLVNDIHYTNFFLKRLNKSTFSIQKVKYGGLHEESVLSIFNDLTKSKTDLSVYLNNEERINFSLKKSEGGQVFLINKERFINGFEKMFNTTISESVKQAIYLFWSGKNDPSLNNIINSYNSNFKNYEIRKNRLTASTLFNYDSTLYYNLLTWFRENIYNLTIFCFATGLSIDRKSYSHYVWFKNLVDNNKNMDELFCIENIARQSYLYNSIINYGTRNGGTTIVLPFGSVQWHQNQLQFRHDLKSIKAIMNI